MGADPARVLHLYTIYERQAERPDGFAVRHFTAGPGQVSVGELLGTAGTLTGARALVPARAGHNMGRQPDDDAVIVETWI